MTDKIEKVRKIITVFSLMVNQSQVWAQVFNTPPARITQETENLKKLYISISTDEVNSLFLLPQQVYTHQKANPDTELFTPIISKSEANNYQHSCNSEAPTISWQLNNSPFSDEDAVKTFSQSISTEESNELAKYCSLVNVQLNKLKQIAPHSQLANELINTFLNDIKIEKDFKKLIQDEKLTPSQADNLISLNEETKLSFKHSMSAGAKLNLSPKAFQYFKEQLFKEKDFLKSTMSAGAKLNLSPSAIQDINNFINRQISLSKSAMSAGAKLNLSPNVIQTLDQLTNKQIATNRFVMSAGAKLNLPKQVINSLLDSPPVSINKATLSIGAKLNLNGDQQDLLRLAIAKKVETDRVVMSAENKLNLSKNDLLLLTEIQAQQVTLDRSAMSAGAKLNLSISDMNQFQNIAEQKKHDLRQSMSAGAHLNISPTEQAEIKKILAQVSQSNKSSLSIGARLGLSSEFLLKNLVIQNKQIKNESSRMSLISKLPIPQKDQKEIIDSIRDSIKRIENLNLPTSAKSNRLLNTCLNRTLSLNYPNASSIPISLEYTAAEASDNEIYSCHPQINDITSVQNLTTQAGDILKNKHFDSVRGYEINENCTLNPTAKILPSKK